jgi:hypothetical protein
MKPNRLAVAASWCVLLVGALAYADAEEATLNVEGGVAVFRGETPVFSSDTTTRPGGAGGVRLTYGLTDLLAAEVGVGTAIGAAFEYRDQDGGEMLGRGTSHYDLRAVRATAGVTARFGARWIPTANLALGYQHRSLTGGAFIDENRVLIDEIPGDSSSDLLVCAGVGLEYRIDRRFLVGVSAQLVHAFALGGPAFDAVEVPVRVSYAWYPGWFRSTSVERLDDD